MQVHVLRGMRHQVAGLAAEDKALLDEARQDRHDLEQRLREVQEELSEACVREETVARMSHSSGRLLATLDKQLQERLADGVSAASASAAGHGVGPETQPSPRDAVRSFLQHRYEATAKEIAEHVRQVHPELHTNAPYQTLSRLAKKGLLERPREGVYRLSGDWAIPES
ncbi:hypothetical protein RGQ21_00390 [Kitasatospora aureofaciens]|nr:hypothetical protein RGQ21_00390 [Kitasatospora aureofaciens]